MSVVKDLNVRLSIQDNFFHIAFYMKYVCLLTNVLVCIKFIWFCIHYLVFTVDLGEKAK